MFILQIKNTCYLIISHYYALLFISGGVTGVCSIWTLACISIDRYNIICNGFNGPKLTKGKATLMCLWCWFLGCFNASPPFWGWGGYSPEGIMSTCSFDYLTQDINVSLQIHYSEGINKKYRYDYKMLSHKL